MFSPDLMRASVEKVIAKLGSVASLTVDSYHRAERKEATDRSERSRGSPLAAQQRHKRAFMPRTVTEDVDGKKQEALREVCFDHSFKKTCEDKKEKGRK